MFPETQKRGEGEIFENSRNKELLKGDMVNSVNAPHTSNMTITKTFLLELEVKRLPNISKSNLGGQLNIKA